MPKKNARVKAELIDVDLVRGLYILTIFFYLRTDTGGRSVIRTTPGF